MNQEPYDHEANWIAESCAKNYAYAIEATDALWAALEKLDKGDTKINAEIRTSITGLSYLVGSTERLKGFYQLTSPDIMATTLTPKSKKSIGQWVKRELIGRE